LKNRSFSALVASGLLLASATLALTACGRVVLYKTPEYPYAGRPVPPSKLLERVLASYTANGSGGGLEILDGLRDLRGNVENTIKTFSITGYSEALPVTIFNFPEQTSGYVFSSNDGNLTLINYSKESGSGSVAMFAANAPSAAATPAAGVFAGAAEQAGLLIISINGATLDLNLPNVYKTVVDRGGQVLLAMVRNSNTLYRVVRLPSTVNPVIPPGSVDCEPLLLPAYCVVPVAGTYDRPSNVAFSLDGTTAYVLNSGPELGGSASSVTFLQMGQLNIDLVPTVDPLSAGAPSPLSPLPVANPILVPGGATDAIADGTNLYVSGQQLQTSGTYNGLFAGNLSLLNLSSYTVGAPIPISDGIHTRMLFADDNTLWIGSSQCANGVRAAVAANELASTGTTDQAGNYNCLTMASLNAATPAAQPTVQIVPAVVQATDAANAVGVPYPNTNQNNFYYGSLTGICWVQNYHKVFTAYGGQIHAFYTGGPITDTNDPAHNSTPAAGSEIDNFNFTVQGTVLDVAYMDAETNSAD
jgi:hypothetical protein